MDHKSKSPALAGDLHWLIPSRRKGRRGFGFDLAVEFDDQVGVDIEWDLVLGWEGCDLGVEF